MLKFKSQTTAVVTIIFSTLVTLTTIGVVVAYLIPDASANYTGIKKEVANYAVGNAWELSHGINYASIAGTIRISVEDVSAISNPGARCNSEFASSAEPSAGDYFLVTVGYRTFLGVLLKTDEFHICRNLYS